LLTCEVNLNPPNHGSIRFHQRIGFSEVGQQESKPGLTVSMLAKKLG
jgi:predicted GNAT superfamily acetyltransferase